MLLFSIGILLVLAGTLAWSIFTPAPKRPRDEPDPVLPWHSDYKQLRVEYHQFVDKSVPPKQ